MLFANITENTTDYNNLQITENTGYIQDEIENTDNLKINLSNIASIDHVKENTSNSKSNTLRQHEKHKKFAFIKGVSTVKDLGRYLLIASINRKFILKIRPFSSAKTLDMQDYTKPNKRDFDHSLYIIHIGTSYTGNNIIMHNQNCGKFDKRN